MEKRIIYTECEHDSDLQEYIDDLQISGAKIINTIPDFENEEATVIVEIENFDNFITAFMVSDGYDFATIL